MEPKGIRPGVANSDLDDMEEERDLEIESMFEDHEEELEQESWRSWQGCAKALGETNQVKIRALYLRWRDNS